MILLLAQIWGFILVASLIGMIAGGLLMLPRRTLRQKELEGDLRTLHDRNVALEAETTDMRSRLSELEGVPEAERKTRIAAREELIARIAKLETDVAVARNGERQLKDEGDELRRQLRTLTAELNDERSKPQPVLEPTPLGVDQDEHDNTVSALQARLDEAQRLADAKAAEAGSLKSKLMEFEGRVARALDGSKETEAFKTRVLELEAQLRQEANAASDRYVALSQRNAELETKLKDAGGKSNIGDLAEIVALRRDAEQALHWKTQAANLESRVSALDAAQNEAQELRRHIAKLEDDLRSTARDNGVSQSLQQKIADLETGLAAEKSRASAAALRHKDELQSAHGELDRLTARLSEADAKIEPLRAAANEAAGLRQRVADAEGRLADLGRDALEAGQMRARIGELESRARELEAAARAGAQAAAEAAPLRARIADLERRLGDAQRAQDEAAILRAQVAEMDGRLGQALRAASDADALRARIAALESKPA